MRTPNPQTFSRISVAAVSLAVALAIVLESASVGARADEIPHENYDLVGSNLDVVIALLNSSIEYSEFALDSMYYQRMDYAAANLSVVSGLIDPAEQLLQKMQDVASSYENLSFLVPPFALLSSQEELFANLESAMIAAKGELVAASLLPNLTGEELTDALNATARVNSLIVQMNNTIDDMLSSATDIIGLEVEGEKPFSQNNLIPLIERLRDLLNITLVEIGRLIENEIQWAAGEPFLLLWLSDTEYYLNESIVGGGYAFFEGHFASNHQIQILMDGANLTRISTNPKGYYSFAFPIPLNASWLGQHTLRSSAMTPNGTISSDSILIRIVLIPTTIRLEASSFMLALPESTIVEATLKDARSMSVADASCYIIVDETNTTFSTDASGHFADVWQAANLGYGTHEFQAFYEGQLPYAPSASNIVTVVVNIPTTVTVMVFSGRFFVQQSIVGNGSLKANDSEPLGDQHITILIDGIAVVNATTDSSGVFAFAIPASSTAVGTHTLTAAFLDRDAIWRYSQDEVNFKVFAQKHGKYPFLPIIPGWGGGIPETIPYLFFGEYAYFTWLLILALLGILIRILQMRKAKRAIEAGEAYNLRPLEEMAAAPEIAAGPPSEIFTEASFEGRAPASPNEKVIWYYHNLLLFLTKKRMIGLKDSMTHWEVARILRALGYPLKHVEKATLLFERAMYSGTNLTESDTIDMSSSFGHIVSKRAQEVAHAV